MKWLPLVVNFTNNLLELLRQFPCAQKNNLNFGTEKLFNLLWWKKLLKNVGETEMDTCIIHKIKLNKLVLSYFKTVILLHHSVL